MAAQTGIHETLAGAMIAQAKTARAQNGRIKAMNLTAAIGALVQGAAARNPARNQPPKTSSADMGLKGPSLGPRLVWGGS